MNAVIFCGILILSYLIGSINSAIIVGKLFGGDDIRSHGSGNAGATNALRTYGVTAAVFVTIGDCLKSAICCIVAIIASKLLLLEGDFSEIALCCAGVGVVLGHNFPLYFGFKGGKGILVSVTALIFADWKIGVAVLVLSVLLIVITKYVSLGSISGAVMFIIAAFVFKIHDRWYVVLALILGLLAIIRHNANIKRLLNGTESKIGSGKKKN